MKPRFANELEGQQYFFETYLPRIDHNLTIEEIQNDFTDGVFRGTIVEFKLNINDMNAVLFQTIKYLSSMRLKGKPVPANIILVSLSSQFAYHFHSVDYLEFIEKVYAGGASRENTGFAGGLPVATFDYSKPEDEERMIGLMRKVEFTKINIDENCIVGWAEKYYRENPSARKGDFIGDQTGHHNTIGEIRKPTKFKDFIKPYVLPDNEKFRYLMDKLNDFLQKKTLGAFYTSELYAKKSLELVRQAIARVPQGNDYVIIDRCAGTGNLEKYLTDEELSHCIVSTIEYYEYKVLLQVLGDKVRHIIPPAEHEDTYIRGHVRGADALSEEYVNNTLILDYVNNPRCTIILFENPPYTEPQARETNTKAEWKKSFVAQEMKREVKGVATNDLSNLFIWSAFKYYLRQPTDSYILYSPAKYWKAQHLVNKRFLNGFAFNRKHFHTNINACIMCVLWSNEDADLETFTLSAFDIDVKTKTLVSYPDLGIHRIHSLFSQQFYDKTSYPDDVKGIAVGLDGLEWKGDKISIKPIYNPNIVGYMIANSSGFDTPDLSSSLGIAGLYKGHGFYLRQNNYLEKLPMFAASRFYAYNREWTERGRIMKSADGAVRFRTDVKSGKATLFLYKCLLFTCFEPQNHIRSFRGSDGRNYVNRLCLDDSHGETMALRDIAKMKMNDCEKKLFAQWQRILEEAKKTKGYIPSLTYGLYQIKSELNTSHKEEKSKRTIYDYPILNGHIKTLATMVKDYYCNEIVPTLFEYEFLK